MYQAVKPRKNAKKFIENPIAKCKKVVLDFLHIEKIIQKSVQAGYPKN